MAINQDKDELIKSLPNFLKTAIKSEIEKVVKFELVEAQKRVEQQASQIIAGVMLYVERQINIERFNDNVIISVRLPKIDEKL